MASIIVSILSVVLSPILTLIGIVIVQNHTDKRHSKDLKSSEDKTLDERFNEMDDKHNSNLAKISDEYKKEFTEVKDSIRELGNALSDYKSSNQQTVATISLQIANLDEKVHAHNNLIERTYRLESDVRNLDTREKISEKRLKDLERHEEEKKVI